MLKIWLIDTEPAIALPFSMVSPAPPALMLIMSPVRWASMLRPEVAVTSVSTTKARVVVSSSFQLKAPARE